MNYFKNTGNVQNYIENFYHSFRWQAYREYAAGLIPKKNKPGKILDAGSGPSPSLPEFLDQNIRYICLDGSYENLQKLSKDFRSISGIQANFENGKTLPLKGTFDLVIAFGVLQYLKYPQKFIADLASLMPSGGYFLTHNPSEYWNKKMFPMHGKGFSRPALTKLVESHFEIIFFKTINFPLFEKVISKCLRRISGGPTLDRIVWRIAFRVETILNSLGFQGTDHLVLARKI